jgi:hypothetical protein
MIKKYFISGKSRTEGYNLSHYDERHWKNQEQNGGNRGSRNVKVPGHRAKLAGHLPVKIPISNE